METSPPNSELRLQSSTDQLTATAVDSATWHVFGVLLGCRRPTPLEELASKCSFFRHTPNCIQFLCSIPNSPIRLTAERFVTLSKAGLVAIMQFLVNSGLNSMYFDLPEFASQPLKIADSNEMVKTYYTRRKRLRSEIENFAVMKRRIPKEFSGEDIVDISMFMMHNRFQNLHSQEYLFNEDISGKIMSLSSMSSILTGKHLELQKVTRTTSALTNTSSGQLGNEKENNEPGTKDMNNSFSQWNGFGYKHPNYGFCGTVPPTLKPLVVEQIMNSMPPQRLSLPQRILGIPNASQHSETDALNSLCGTYICSSSQLEVDQQIAESVEKEAVIEACASLTTYVSDKWKELLLRDSGSFRERKKILPLHESESGRKNVAEANYVALFQDISRPIGHLPCARDMLKSDKKNAPSSREKITCQTTEKHKHVDPPTKPQNIQNRKKKPIPLKKNLKTTPARNINFSLNAETAMENKERFSNSINNLAPQNDFEEKTFPKFKSFIVEEEEGSGGYGTVYKALRKSDGVAFAIKCPHVNANRNHVHNELKMLERFGGKNFVIKYEGLLKNGNSDCIVLEHVEHDRPEVLKKEIDVFQLQWYGYCMFRALSTLHKQGIVHRDVKPGNFLFSRKVNKGYLIDFNLALDLHKKQGSTANSRAGHDVNVDNISLPLRKSQHAAQNRNFLNAKFPEANIPNAGKDIKSLLPPSNLKRKEKVFVDNFSRNNIKNQGADGSGITSAKDPTSTRTQSGERLREPIPHQGRKELINLVYEALQGANNESLKASTGKRKRVAAPPVNVDSKLIYPTPMPLPASGVVIGGAALFKNRGARKHKGEGPCVGTKGFRAPEVLLRSLHQGPKLDVWSAGVTLLYLMIGRAPFIGDPDQNMKEIAKLRGSEDLWEVAKLHNQESSFSTELLDEKYLLPVKFHDWCARNTRRPFFLERIPISLLDLVDKCLTVNPRLRISADEALMHEFFAPCHEVARRQAA